MQGEGGGGVCQCSKRNLNIYKHFCILLATTQPTEPTAPAETFPLEICLFGQVRAMCQKSFAPQESTLSLEKCASSLERRGRQIGCNIKSFIQLQSKCNSQVLYYFLFWPKSCLTLCDQALQVY